MSLSISVLQARARPALRQLSTNSRPGLMTLGPSTALSCQTRRGRPVVSDRDLSVATLRRAT